MTSPFSVFRDHITATVDHVRVGPPHRGPSYGVLVMPPAEADALLTLLGAPPPPIMPALPSRVCTCGPRRSHACDAHGAWCQFPPLPSVEVPPAPDTERQAIACSLCAGAGGRYDGAAGTWAICPECSGAGATADEAAWDGVVP